MRLWYRLSVCSSQHVLKQRTDNHETQDERYATRRHIIFGLLDSWH